MEYMSPVEEYLYSETLNRAGHERWYSSIREAQAYRYWGRWSTVPTIRKYVQ